MSDEDKATAHTLETFVEVLRHLSDEGLTFTVIGGCAVGVYARQIGTTVVSGDLDVFVSEETLVDLLRSAPSWGATVLKRPQPRSVGTAVLDWQGLEINALTSATGFSAPDVVARTATDVELAGLGVTVPIADPFELLRNKLAVRRPKDLPHIDLLRAYVREFVVESFGAEGTARERLGPARAYLEVFGERRLDEDLARRLVGSATEPALRRFVGSRWPADVDAAELTSKAEDDEEAADLRRLLSLD